MRFHHSTRRGKTNRFGGHSGSHRSGSLLASSDLAHSYQPTSTSRWSQLGYCRETNIIFNRRLPVEPPQEINRTIAINDKVEEERQQQVIATSSDSGFIEQQSPCSFSNVNDPDVHSKSKISMAAVKGNRYNNNSRNNTILSSIKTTRTSNCNIQQQHLINENQLKGLKFNYSDNSNYTTTQVAHNKKRTTAAAGANQNRNSRNEFSLFHENNINDNNNSKLNMDIIRDKLVAKVDKHPFWSKKAARRMELTSCKDRNLYIYELISYCERRELEWRYEAYRGGLVSSIPYKRVMLDSATSAMNAPLSFNTNSALLSSTGSSLAPAGASSSLSHLTHQSTNDSMKSSSSIKNPTSSRKNSRSSIVPLPLDQLQQQQQQHQLEQQEAIAAALARIQRPALKTSDFVWSQNGDFMMKKGEDTHGGRTLYEPVSAIERPVPSNSDVWSIEIPKQQWPAPFVGHVYATEFPNSSFVKRCHGCQGRGRLKCPSCYGVGYEVCISCSGKGTTKSHSSFATNSSLSARGSSRSSDYYNRNSMSASYNDDGDNNFLSSSSSNSKRNYGEPGGITGGSGNGGGGLSAWTTESCHFCHGAGQKRCWICAGKSYNYCAACLGSGKLRCYLQLIVTWINHRDETSINNSDNIIPKERLRLCSGLLLADEIGDKLEALNRQRIDGATGRFEESNQLHLASKKLLDKHKTAYRQERFIKQVS